MRPLCLGIDSVWLRRENTGEALVRWTVLDRNDGESTVLLPAGVEVLEITGEAILGSLRDEDDVPSVVRFRLKP